MDKASDFESEDWGFESLRGRFIFDAKQTKCPAVRYFLYIVAEIPVI